MKNKFLKIFLLAVIIISSVLMLASCGNTNAADDDEGEYGNFHWEYTKDDKTLRISGKGNIFSAPSSENVGWKEVRASVEKVIITATDGDVTEIGDYAFYYMPNLKEITIPSTVTKIGKCAFAFCSSLDKIDIPSGVTSIGESAFEACSKLTSISLPESVTSIGSRAFAFCNTLESVIIKGSVKNIEKWTFKNCTSLSVLRMDKAGVEFDGAAFEGCKIDKNAVKSVHTSVVEITCKDEEGATIKTDTSTVLEKGETKTITAPNIEGYTVTGESSVEKTGTGEKIPVTFTYKKNAEASDSTSTDPASTDKPANTEEDPDQTGIIVTLVIFAVVIGAIIVGAILLIRSDKKQKAAGTTVRKNQNNNTKKKK